MPKIIKGTAIIEDNWQLLSAEASLEEVTESAHLIVTLSFWQQHKAVLNQRKGQTGVWLAAEEEIEHLVQDLALLPLIALDFPAFTDGRHYSSARILREGYGYQGEIRAIGDVLKDQLFAMKRCGFDAFAVRSDKNIETALTSLYDFSVVYQAATAGPEPLRRV